MEENQVNYKNLTNNKDKRKVFLSVLLIVLILIVISSLFGLSFYFQKKPEKSYNLSPTPFLNKNKTQYSPLTTKKKSTPEMFDLIKEQLIKVFND